MDKKELSKILTTIELLERMTSLQWSYMKSLFVASCLDGQACLEINANGDRVLWTLYLFGLKYTGDATSITRALGGAAAAACERKMAIQGFEDLLRKHRYEADELPARVESGGGGASIEADELPEQLEAPAVELPEQLEGVEADDDHRADLMLAKTPLVRRTEEEYDQIMSKLTEAPAVELPARVDEMTARQQIPTSAKRLILENPHCGACGARYEGRYISFDSWVYEAKIEGIFYRYRINADFVCRQCGALTSSNYYSSSPE